MLGLTADATYADIPEPDVIVFPGGVGTRRLQDDGEVLDWVRHAHATTRFTTSVCTGSLVLGAAGLLTVLAATTHWACYPELAVHGAFPTAQRVVEHLDHRIITAAGVSSGIDMALRLVELLVDRTAAEAAQLMIEYDPQPPFDAGAVANAGEATLPGWRVRQPASSRGGTWRPTEAGSSVAAEPDGRASDGTRLPLTATSPPARGELDEA